MIKNLKNLSAHYLINLNNRIKPNYKFSLGLHIFIIILIITLSYQKNESGKDDALENSQEDNTINNSVSIQFSTLKSSDLMLLEDFNIVEDNLNNDYAIHRLDEIVDNDLNDSKGIPEDNNEFSNNPIDLGDHDTVLNNQNDDLNNNLQENQNIEEITNKQTNDMVFENHNINIKESEIIISENNSKDVKPPQNNIVNNEHLASIDALNDLIYNPKPQEIVKDDMHKTEKDQKSGALNEITRKEKYILDIQKRIYRNWNQSDGQKGWKCRIQVFQNNDGVVIDYTIVDCENNINFQEGIVSAIMKSSPFPLPEENDFFDPLLDFIFIID